MDFTRIFQMRTAIFANVVLVVNIRAKLNEFKISLYLLFLARSRVTFAVSVAVYFMYYDFFR